MPDRNGGHSIRLRQSQVHSDAEAALLQVVDDGPGFPPDAAERLRSRGGLAGIRERVTVLGGEVSFGNVNGRGAQVRVRIPAGVER